MFRRLSLLIAGLATLAGCELPTEPFPSGAVPFEPPQAYATWWQLTSACSGVSGDFSAIRWFVVPGAQTIPVRGREYHGAWYRDGNRIVLAEGAQQSGPLVRHEMLHALIDRGGHPREYYRSRCGGIVVCQGECESETGGDLAPANAAAGPPTDLEVDLDVIGGGPRSSESRWVGVMVTVRNPDTRARRVRLSELSQSAAAVPTFGYELDRAGGGPWGGLHEFVLDTVITFEAGETRRRLFDLWLPSREWVVRGFFNSERTQPLLFRVD